MEDEAYARLSQVLIQELRRHTSKSKENIFAFPDLDSWFLEKVILQDPTYLDYLLTVFKEIEAHTKNRTLPYYYYRWSALLVTLGIDYILVTEATGLSLKRINEKVETKAYLSPADFSEFLFLIVLAHDYQAKI